MAAWLPNLLGVGHAGVPAPWTEKGVLVPAPCPGGEIVTFLPWMVAKTPSLDFTSLGEEKGKGGKDHGLKWKQI